MRMAQRVFATRGAAREIEGAIGAVNLHLMDDPKEAPEFAARPAALREPLKILGRQVVDRDAARRKVIGAEFPERHVQSGDIREVCGHVVRERVFHAGERIRRGAAAGQGPPRVGQTEAARHRAPGAERQRARWA